MEWIRSQEQIESELFQIEQSFFNSMVSYDKAISYCQHILEEYRIAVVSNGFPDEEAEIQFFKKDKPFLFGLLLQYNHQLSFELNFPNIPYGGNDDIVNKKIEEVTAFLSSHKDMVLYLELQSKTFDSQFFLRKNRGLFTYPGRHDHSFDSEFCTSHDGLIANIVGYQGFLQFLQQKMSTSMPFPETRHSKINWTGSKIALTELGFALFYSGAVNHGNASLKSIIQLLEQVTGTDLGDYHHTAIRIRNRSQRTKFMDKLKISLQNWMANLDE
ncbi:MULTISPECIES: RteC domain-containing protein [Arenibacter]|uniref:RteC domain-containing protein n=1 Tax=Arenibacter TaxID=178469 RepID=UPI0004DED10E|nr:MULTISPECIES: RteC domain-containing protein [Arenibacter]GBF18049.1 rteC protein [Arenibacter sp. NBRC 103722]